MTIIIQGCSHDLEKLSPPGMWRIPIAHGNLGLDDILSDTILTSSGNDSLLKIIFSKPLASYALKDLVEPIETEFLQNIKLSSIDLGTTEVTEPITLGEVSKQAGVTGVVIIANNGNMMEIPPVNNLPPFDFPIDASDFFESMTLNDGFIDLSFDNGFPIDITNLSYEVRNEVNGDLIFADVIDTLKSLEKVTRTYPLAGKVVEGVLDAQILTMSSPGSYGNQVLIDTSDALVVNMKIRDLDPTEATAVFPQQTLANDTKVRHLEAADNLKLTSMVLRSGTGVMDASSTIQDSIRFTYTIPSLTLNGAPYTFSGTIPPAPPGSASNFKKVFDLTGFTLDLTGPTLDTVNTFYDHIEAYIDSSGVLTYLSLDDSLYINSFTTNVLPEVAYGSIERDTIVLGPDTVQTNLFQKITGGNLNLEDISVSMVYSNSIGVPIDARVDALSSIGKTSMDLTGPIIGVESRINEASLNAGLPVPVELEFDHNASNSNMVPFIENLPSALGYSGQIVVNPDETPNPNRFLFYNDGLEIRADVELPLSLGVDELELQDTIDWNLDLDLSLNPTGNLDINIVNGFPYGADFEILFLDAQGNQSLSFASSDFLLPAQLGGNGIVNAPAEQTVNWVLTKENIQTLTEAKQAILHLKFGSHPIPANMYANYKMDIKIAGTWEFEN